MDEFTLREKISKTLISKGFKTRLVNIIAEHSEEIAILEREEQIKVVASLSYDVIPSLLKLAIRKEKFEELFINYSGALKMQKIIKKALKRKN